MANSLDLAKTYHLLWSVTGSITLHSNNILFDASRSDSFRERIKSCFDEVLPSEFHIKDLNEFAEFTEAVKRGEKLRTFHRANKPQAYLSYKLSYSKSSILNFRDISQDSEFEKYWNANWNKLISKSIASSKELIFNEWAMLGNHEMKRYAEDWKVAYDLLLFLGIRRSALFRPQLALRVFNISLPVGRLKPRPIKVPEDGEERKAYQTEVSSFLIVPIITLNAKPGNNYFRKSLSLSLLLIPIDESFTGTRKVSAHEICHINGDTEFELIDSPLKDFLLNFKLASQEQIQSIPELLEIVCRTVCDIINNGCDIKEQEQLWELAYDQLSFSKQITQCILSPMLDNATIEKFHLSKMSPDFRRELRSIITPEQYFRDKSYFQFPDVVNFEKMVIIDESMIDSNYLTFFNKESSKLIGFMYNGSEHFPEFSVKWLFDYEFYMSVSMSILDTMIHDFYKELVSVEHDAEKLGNLEKEFFKDIDEFYDLDNYDSDYKEMFKKLRSVDGLERDFEELKERLQALKTNLVLDEQRKVNKEQEKINKRIEILSVISIGIAIFAIIVVIFGK
jgi:hypothetical protein